MTASSSPVTNRAKLRNREIGEARVQWYALEDAYQKLSRAPSESTFKLFCRKYRLILSRWLRIDRSQPGEYDGLAEGAVELGAAVLGHATRMGAISDSLIDAIERHLRDFDRRLALSIADRVEEDKTLSERSEDKSGGDDSARATTGATPKTAS